MKQRVYRIVFWAYCAVMAVLLFGRTRLAVDNGYWNTLSSHLNLIPFQTVGIFIDVLKGDNQIVSRQYAVVNLLGNVLMFLPLGFLLPALWERFRKWWKALLWGGLIIVCVELAQLFALVGKCDVDDLILNMLGIAGGYGIFRLFYPRSTENNP